MNEAVPALPEVCSRALASVQVDPLEPGAEAEAHLKACRACSEARIAFLAQEDACEALAPTGYHDRLPDRLVRKLPARPSLHHQIRPLVWTAAAALLMAVGAGAFWAGRANRAPLVEAALPRPAEVIDLTVTADTPFHDHEEDAAQIQSFTPEEMSALLKRMEAPASSPQ